MSMKRKKTQENRTTAKRARRSPVTFAFEWNQSNIPLGLVFRSSNNETYLSSIYKCSIASHMEDLVRLSEKEPILLACYSGRRKVCKPSINQILETYKLCKSAKMTFKIELLDI